MLLIRAACCMLNVLIVDKCFNKLALQFSLMIAPDVPASSFFVNL
jgi:hypothetical protein